MTYCVGIMYNMIRDLNVGDSVTVSGPPQRETSYTTCDDLPIVVSEYNFTVYVTQAFSEMFARG